MGQHRLAADADELRIRFALPDRRHQATAQDVAGGLSGNDADAQRMFAGRGAARSAHFRRRSRTMPCSDDSMDATNRATSGTVSATGAQLAQRLLQGQPAPIDGVVGVLQGLLHRVARAEPAQPFDVEADGACRIAVHGDVGGNVLGRERHRAHEGVGADAAELRHAGVAAQHRLVAHADVACDRGVVGHHDPVAEHAVVADVDVGHEQIVAADHGAAAVLGKAAVDGDAFPDDVVVADGERRRLPVVGERRRAFADGGELEDAVAATEHRRPAQDHVRADLAVVADHDVRPDDGPRPHRDVGAENGLGVHDGPLVDLDTSRPAAHDSIFPSTHMSLTEQASSPSTWAWQSNFISWRRRLAISPRRVSTSPGRTWRLKRASSRPAR